MRRDKTQGHGPYSPRFVPGVPVVGAGGSDDLDTNETVDTTRVISGRDRPGSQSPPTPLSLVPVRGLSQGPEGERERDPSDNGVVGVAPSLGFPSRRRSLGFTFQGPTTLGSPDRRLEGPRTD